MHFVAVHGMTGPIDALARSLATVLGKTAYEMRSRASAPHGGPTIVGTYSTLDAARTVADALDAAGFQTLVETPDAARGEWRSVFGRKVELGDAGQDLVFEDRAGDRHSVAPATVQLLLAGVGHWTETQTDVQKGRKFSAGRAVLSGGLMLTRKTVTKQTTTQKGGDRYLGVYAAGRCFLLYETQLQYGSLGALMQPSRALNFKVVERELRARCEGAAFDNRLLTRVGQTQVLGPAFQPESHGDLAAALVARTLIA